MPKFRLIYPILLAIILISGKSCGCSCNKPVPPNIQVCFTPGCQCIHFIEEAIAKAEKSILVQAYFFTSSTIAKALVKAHNKDIHVQLMVDRSQLDNKSSKIFYLMQQGIPIWLDNIPGIAHNKVMIIDDEYVLTGSFNWTEAAQKCNAENLILIKDLQTNQAYKANWNQRLAEAERLIMKPM